jgi:hypothetical protein
MWVIGPALNGHQPRRAGATGRDLGHHQEVDETEFDVVRAALMRDFPPSASHDLAGMEIDFNAYLYGLDDLLSEANAKMTGDPSRLIVATATGKPIATPDAVASALEDVWLTRLRYTYKEAHIVRTDDRSVRLDAVTQIAPDGFYVTAEILVTWPDK